MYRSVILLSMLLFIVLLVEMHRHSGMYWSERMWALIFAASALATCLAVAVWKSHIIVPIMNSRADRLLAAILTLELAYCIGGAVALVIKMYP